MVSSFLDVASLQARLLPKIYSRWLQAFKNVKVQKFVCVANIGVPHLSVYGGITGTDGFMLRVLDMVNCTDRCHSDGMALFTVVSGFQTWVHRVARAARRLFGCISFLSWRCQLLPCKVWNQANVCKTVSSHCSRNID